MAMISGVTRFLKFFRSKMKSNDSCSHLCIKIVNDGPSGATTGRHAPHPPGTWHRPQIWSTIIQLGRTHKRLRHFGLWVRTFGLWVRTFGLWVRTFGLWVRTFGLWVRTLGSDFRTLGSDFRTLGSDFQTLGSDFRTLGSDLMAS